MTEKDVLCLIKWYQKNKRDLPWRKTKDAYKIWLSEVMLQQTGVQTVISYYERFLKACPDLESLSKIDTEKVLKLWEGLGYYHRALNLQKCAQKLVSLGYTTLPNDKILLDSLPGLGPYTVGAILSICYDELEPAIDGNVKRVLSRVYEEEGDISKPKLLKEYTEKLKFLMKKGQTRDFTEAFIELGATVCSSKKVPLCEKCPLNKCCGAYHHESVSLYPVKAKKSVKKEEDLTVIVFHYHNKYVIYKREEKLLKGMYAFYSLKGYLDEKEITSQTSFNIKSIIYKGKVSHTFSHIIWNMQVYLVELLKKPSKELLVTKDELETVYSMPTAYKKVFLKILD